MGVDTVLVAAICGAVASPLAGRQESATCSDPKQMPKCCQFLLCVTCWGETVLLELHVLPVRNVVILLS
jgi:hypothetical protein